MKVKNDRHLISLDMLSNDLFHKSKILFLLCFLFIILLTSCDFNNTNLDPTRPTDAELKEILPVALTQTAHNLTSIGGRITGIIVQHFDGIDAQPESYAHYLIDERALDEFWRTGLYGGAMKDCAILIEKASEIESPHYRGIAKILMAINLGIATSFWGDIPFEDAFQGIDNLQPKYDLQESIYDSIQSFLGAGIEDLQKLPSDNPPQNDDLIFEGDASKWIATAKALRARYFLHLTKRDPNAAQKILDLIGHSIFQDLADQANFPFSSNLNEANPLPLYWFERPDQMVMSDYLYELLETTNDPRLARLAFIKNGLPMIYHQDSSQLHWGQFAAALPLISLTELKFIEAEAHLRLDNTESAESIFKEAVTVNFQQLDIPNAVFQSFLDVQINFNNHSTFEEQLAWLIQQKHLALFAQNSIEAWVDYRRTGFPILDAPPNANPSFNPSLVIPRRYLYPISERNTNELNWMKAINRQGGHLLDFGLWAYQ